MVLQASLKFKGLGKVESIIISLLCRDAYWTHSRNTVVLFWA